MSNEKDCFICCKAEICSDGEVPCVSCESEDSNDKKNFDRDGRFCAEYCSGFKEGCMSKEREDELKEKRHKLCFLKSLENTLKLCRCSVKKLDFEEGKSKYDLYVVITFTNGYSKKVDITADSEIAIIKDVIKNIL